MHELFDSYHIFPPLERTNHHKQTVFIVQTLQNFWNNHQQKDVLHTIDFDEHYCYFFKRQIFMDLLVLLEFILNMRCTILIIILIVTTLQSNFQTVAIIGTNDIHGAAFPTNLFRVDTNQTYNYGGLQFMAQMIQTIKDQYEGQVIYLDAGDQFQGGIQSSSLVSQGQIMNDFYNTINVEGSAVGNHQFDFGPNFLFPFWDGRDKTSPNLAANLQSEKGEQNFLPLQKGQMIYQLKSGIKIGVIGLITLETPASTGAFADGLFPPYQFLNYTDIVQQRSKKLRSAGAHAVLILSHVGNDCDTTNQYGIWDKYTKQTSTCLQTDEMTVLINSLPEGTIDGVVQGHRHKFSHHFIKGIPVMGTINGGYYFNVMYLKFYNYQIYDRKIQGPIPVCQRVFQNIGTCNYLKLDQLAVAGPLVSWQFHGKTVQKHKELQNIFDSKWLPLMKPYLQPLAINEVYMERISTYQNDLGNLITNLMFAAAPGNDFVIINPGTFRTTWTPGILQYQHFYNMFPFKNTINSFQMTGKELLDTLTILQSGLKGFYPTYGLSQVVSLSGNVKKFISAKLYNGTEIDPAKTYRGVSVTFLTEGGDDFKDVIGKVYTVRKEILYGDFRELVKPQLVKLKTIKQNSLVDPLHPRLTVVPG